MVAGGYYSVRPTTYQLPFGVMKGLIMPNSF